MASLLFGRQWHGIFDLMANPFPYGPVVEQSEMCSIAKRSGSLGVVYLRACLQRSEMRMNCAAPIVACSGCDTSVVLRTGGLA
jgi:hypothetical protein